MPASSDSPLKPLVSVLTPSIPERASLLVECQQSVRSQTFGPIEHLVLIDSERQGCSVTMNKLAAEASAEWLVPLADDDLLLPGALAALVAHSDAADIVWSRPLVWGNGSAHLVKGEPPCIPSFALIRTSLWRDLGGYDEGVIREEDRGLWRKALEAGARFVQADSVPTWVYRFHGGNKSYNGGIAS